MFLYSLKTKQKDELMNYLMVANLFVCLDNFICNSFGIQDFNIRYKISIFTKIHTTLT